MHRALPQTLSCCLLLAALACGGGGGTAQQPVVPVPTACLWRFDPAAGPAWFACQDGTGAWTRVTGTAGAFGFTLLQGTGAVAYALEGSGAASVVLTCGSAAELAARDLRPAQGATLTVSGTYAGVPANGGANLSLGFRGTTYADGALGSSGPWTMDYLAQGVQDLLGVSLGADGTPARILIHRGLDLETPGSLGAAGDLDFSAEGTPLAPGTLTVTGAGPAAGERLKVWQDFVTAQGTAFLTGAYLDGTLAMPICGVPAGIRAAGDADAYAVQLGPDDGTGYISRSDYRTVWSYGLAPGDVAVAAPAALGVPAASVAATLPYVRIRTRWAFGPVFNGSFSAAYTQGTTLGWTLTVLPGYGAGFDVTFPDFSAAPGWNRAWAMTAGTPVSAVFQGAGSTWSAWPPPAGARTSQAASSLTLNP